jgi:hypothetical protein
LCVFPPSRIDLGQSSHLKNGACKLCFLLEVKGNFTFPCKPRKRIKGGFMLRFALHQVAAGLCAALPAVGVGAFGLAALGWLMLTTPAPATSVAAAQIGVVLAPWSQTGITAAARFELPIIDLRWGGHLVVLDVSQSPNASQRLRDFGYFVINTTAASGCLSQRTTDAEPI